MTKQNQSGLREWNGFIMYIANWIIDIYKNEDGFVYSYCQLVPNGIEIISANVSVTYKLKTRLCLECLDWVGGQVNQCFLAFHFSIPISVIDLCTFAQCVSQICCFFSFLLYIYLLAMYFWHLRTSHTYLEQFSHLTVLILLYVRQSAIYRQQE